MEPLEKVLNVSRAEVSTVFSVATICFTLGMIFGAPIYRRVHAAAIASGCLLTGAAGIALAAGSMSLLMVFVGYGVIFSMANALGYNLTLQLVNTELRQYSAVATGIVTACYALGSVTSAPVLVYAIRQFGVWNTLFGLALFLVCAAMISGLLLVLAKTTLACPPLQSDTASPSLQPRLFIKLWIGYAFGALAGLMVISHAAGIVSSYGGAPAQIALGAMLVNIGNVTGRFSGGWFSQRFHVRRVLAIVMAFASVVLAALAFFPAVWLALVVLMFIGFVYGSNASTYPISVTIYYCRTHMAKIFGILMTAWGTAGLTAPWIAGFVFDSTGQYKYAILVAAGAAFLGSIISLTLPDQDLWQIPDESTVYL
ncbi:MAG: MFS transporter [Bacillota bacterium]|nr:MFS transporter [Bacillota bacterium]MDW7684485.1 MFS transporter [Bacillota bacterium]